MSEKIRPQNGDTALQAAVRDLVEIVEGVKGSMEHGCWLDKNGMRFKDTPEWVRLYVAMLDDTVEKAASAMKLKDAMWISDYERIRGYPCVFDHPRDRAEKYYRARVVVALKAEKESIDSEKLALERAFVNFGNALRRAEAQNDRLVRMLAERRMQGRRAGAGENVGDGWDCRMEQEIAAIRAELEGGGDGK